MEQYVGWAIVIAITILMATFIYYRPNLRDHVIATVINLIDENEGWIVQAIYNKLPTKAKLIGSQQIASIVGYVLAEIIDILEVFVKQKDVK